MCITIKPFWKLVNRVEQSEPSIGDIWNAALGVESNTLVSEPALFLETHNWQILFYQNPKSHISHTADAFAIAGTFGLYKILSGILAKSVEVGLK